MKISTEATACCNLLVERLGKTILDGVSTLFSFLNKGPCPLINLLSKYDIKIKYAILMWTRATLGRP
jgi:hypothetical protein